MKFISFVSAFVVAAGLVVPARAAPQGKRLVLLSTANTQAYMGAWSATFIKAAEPLGFSVTNMTSPFDPALQSQQVDDAIAQKFDAILLVIINQQSIKPALTRAKAAGVPVILVVNPGDPSNDGLYESFIGVDQTELGRLAGENIVKGLAAAGKKTAQIAAVTGTSSQLNSSLRLVGFKEVIAKDPAIKLVAVEDGKWATSLSEEITGNLLVRFSGQDGLDGIFAMADNQASGAIQAIQSASLPLGTKDRGMVVVASNCMKDGIVHIKDGTQYATNTQIPVEEAKIAASKLADYFSGKPLQKQEIVPSHSITAANVDEFAQACSY
jgi:ABC-type sugar transport system substrate-binding protein